MNCHQMMRTQKIKILENTGTIQASGTNNIHTVLQIFTEVQILVQQKYLNIRVFWKAA
jgi:hypothetical protein